MDTLLYPACFYPCKDKQDAYTVVVPDLPGCVTEGDSLANAMAIATEAASGWILDEMEDGRAIPKASNMLSIKPESPDGFVSLLALDMDSYADKYGSKAVRKNLTIPAWLHTFAEANHINYSKVLKDSLASMYQKKQNAKQS
jgi:predicted RNase H-like HicB family nuclease